MSNFAVLILILMYVAICTILVGGWMFGTVSKQGESIQDKIDEDIDSDDSTNDDDFEVGDLL